MAANGILGLLEEKSKKDLRWKDFLKDRAEALATELGQLKGSAMKAGQLLSMYGEHFLPPEANEFLKGLQSQSPPLQWSEIKKILEQELGAERLQELDLDPAPIGSASMGQVHRATVKASGESIAIKVQYPGVDLAIDSDLKALRTMLGVLQILPRGRGVDVLFEEVRSMLHQETDYKLEMKLTEKYGSLLKNDSRFIVPRVIHRFCSSKILATSFEDGVGADTALVRSLPLERRNRLARNFLDLYFSEVFKWGIVQTDPHFGNYKVRLAASGEDQLILLDFGAVREYPPEFMEPYRRMVKASFQLNRDKLQKEATALKFIQPEDSESLKKHFEDFCLMTVEPFLTPEDERNIQGRIASDGSYDWKNSDLPQRLSKKVFQMIQSFELRPPPKEVLFLDRKTGGVFIFLSVLHAKLNSHDLFKAYLAEIPD